MSNRREDPRAGDTFGQTRRRASLLCRVNSNIRILEYSTILIWMHAPPRLSTGKLQHTFGRNKWCLNCSMTHGFPEVTTPMIETKFA
jgi:hypothetical protein